jgi:hypothetical protein
MAYMLAARQDSVLHTQAKAQLEHGMEELITRLALHG